MWVRGVRAFACDVIDIVHCRRREARGLLRGGRLRFDQRVLSDNREKSHEICAASDRVGRGRGFGGVAGRASCRYAGQGAVYKAVPAPYTNWTGPYVGLHIGYGWGGTKWTLTAVEPVDDDDFLGGVQAGFNYQIGGIVVGIEGDRSWTGIKGTQSGDTTPAICIAAIPCQTDVNWLASLTGRAGFTWGRGLIYAKGGAAWARNDYAFVNTATASETRGGWTVGGGVEFLLAHNWSAKIEYSYFDLGTEVLTFNPGATSVRIEQELQTIKLGVNYQFNWGGPVAARY